MQNIRPGLGEQTSQDPRPFAIWTLSASAFEVLGVSLFARPLELGPGGGLQLPCL